MLKPSQIKEKEFAKSTMGGYRTADVDNFLDEVAVSYEQLYKENSELLKKLRLLVDNIEEYRKREQNGEMYSGGDLADAKADAEKIIDDARLEAERIIADAKAQAEQADAVNASVDELRQLREKEEKALADIKAESEKFRKSLLAMYTEHLTLVQSMVDGKPVNKAEKKEETPLKKIDIKEIEVDEKFVYDDIDSFFANAVSDEQNRIKEAFGGFRFEMGIDQEESTLQPEETVSDFEEVIPVEEQEEVHSEVAVEFPSEAELSEDDQSGANEDLQDDADEIKPSFKISFPEDEETVDTEENLDDLFEGFFNSSEKPE